MLLEVINRRWLVGEGGERGFVASCYSDRFVIPVLYSTIQIAPVLFVLSIVFVPFFKRVYQVRGWWCHLSSVFICIIYQVRGDVVRRIVQLE